MLEKAKISCFADEIATDLGTQIALMKELNIHYVEFRSANHKSVADYTLQEAENAGQLLADNGISVSALGSPAGKTSITEDFEPHFEKFRHICRLAAVMRTSYIRIFSFYLPENMPAENCRNEVFRRLDCMTEYARRCGLTLLHENEKGIYGSTIQTCLDLMENFYGDAFQATFDFANFVECTQEPLEAYKILKKYISCVHIKDAVRETGTIVTAGSGDGNIPAVLYSLNQMEYSSFLCLEPHLADFEALKSLELNVRERGRTDGPDAFRSAYQALKDILNSA